jgi:hypothetical protein
MELAYWLYWFLNEIFEHFAIVFLWLTTFLNIFIFLIEVCKYILLVLYYNYKIFRILCYCYIIFLWAICIFFLIYDFYLFIEEVKLYYKIIIKKKV